MLPTSGTPTAARAKKKCLCKIYLLFTKGFLTKFFLSYRKKNHRNRTVEFIESLRRSMGVDSVALMGYDGPDGTDEQRNAI
jgi:hypothetical protein